MASTRTAPPPLPTSVKFATAGLGGVMGWVVVHPFNTCAIRMNLLAAQVRTHPRQELLW